MEKIGFVVLSYNNTVDTIECIKSLQALNTSDIVTEIFLIDNSDSGSHLAEINKEVNAIESFHIENNGYANGNNYGIRIALERGCDYIVVINNDTIVDNNFLNPSLNDLRKNKMCIVAPLIYCFGSNLIWSSGGVYRRFLCDYAMTYDNITEKRNTVFVSGCCFATTKELLSAIGLFDESYFMYNEDVEFCCRAKKWGAEIFVNPESFIFHKESRATGKNSPFQLYYTYRNRLIFAAENYFGFKKFYAIFINIMKILYRAFRFALKDGTAEVRALLYAIKDYKYHNGRYRY